jgi:uncharacterized protein DUF4331
MIWTKNLRAGLAALAMALPLGGCGDDGSAPAPDIVAPSFSRDGADSDEDSDGRGRIYEQVEFLGNPLVSEVTIVKANHAAYNMTQPYNTATFRPQTEAFITSFGRPAALATVLGSVLYPDMLVVDVSKDPGTAGWLSWALANGWGGRKLSDDVVDLGLSAIFSSFLNATNAFCAPFELPLCTDNVATNDKTFGSAFPYLAAPHT